MGKSNSHLKFYNSNHLSASKRKADVTMSERHKRIGGCVQHIALRKPLTIVNDLMVKILFIVKLLSLFAFDPAVKTTMMPNEFLVFPTSDVTL